MMQGAYMAADMLYIAPWDNAWIIITACAGGLYVAAVFFLYDVIMGRTPHTSAGPVI